MVDDRLANAVVRSLSEYLTRKKVSALFDARLENLLGQVQVKLSEPYAVEMFERFRDRPGDNLEANTLRLHLGRAIAEDQEFGRQLARTYGGEEMARTTRQVRWRVVAGVVVVAAVGSAFLVGRTTAATSAVPSAPATVTATVAETVTETRTPSSSGEAPGSSASAAPPESRAPQSSADGDGSALDVGTPVHLTSLPRPNDEWSVDQGDHDVQFTAYSHSLWASLSTCNSAAHHREQQFRLKNFSRFEVKAVGTDSRADPGLVVRFDVFVNTNTVEPLVSVTVNPGETKQLAHDLPPDVFALTLRMSLARTDADPCQRGNAVWGSPYVVAAGS